MTTPLSEQEAVQPTTPGNSFLEQMVATVSDAVTGTVEKMMTPKQSLSPCDWTHISFASALPSEIVDQFVKEKLAYYLGTVQATRVAGLMDGDWSYTNKNGTLVKRLRKAIWEVAKKDEPSVEAALSSYIATFRLDNAYYRIVQKLSWHNGGYGQGSSCCMWSYHRAGRAMLTSLGGMALLVRSGTATRMDGPDKGIGRMWIVPYRGNYILLNNYGISASLQREMLWHHLGRSYPTVHRDLTIVAPGVRPNRSTHAGNPHNDQKVYMNGSVTWVEINNKGAKPSEIRVNPCRCLMRLTGNSAGEDRPICKHCPWADKPGDEPDFQVEPGHEGGNRTENPIHSSDNFGFFIPPRRPAVLTLEEEEVLPEYSAPEEDNDDFIVYDGWLSEEIEDDDSDE